MITCDEDLKKRDCSMLLTTVAAVTAILHAWVNIAAMSMKETWCTLRQLGVSRIEYDMHSVHMQVKKLTMRLLRHVHLSVICLALCSGFVSSFSMDIFYATCIVSDHSFEILMQSPFAHFLLICALQKWIYLSMGSSNRVAIGFLVCMQSFSRNRFFGLITASCMQTIVSRRFKLGTIHKKTAGRRIIWYVQAASALKNWNCETPVAKGT